MKGRVLNPVTGEGIEGIKVVLKKSTSGFPAGEKTVSSTYSANDGSFELTANNLKTTIADCIFDEDKYYWLGWKKDNTYQTYITLPKGKTTQLDYHAVPYGEYQIKIKNINCQGVNDTIIINRTNYVGSFLGKDWILTGCTDYTTDKSKVPMGDIYTKYTVIRNGVSIVTENVFTVVPNQLNVQEINY